MRLGLRKSDARVRLSRRPGVGRAVSLTVDLVRAIRDSLPPTHEWTERDAALLELAERQADIDRLEADIAEGGVRVSGRGADVLNQSFAEARQARVALGRLLGQVEIPDEESTRSIHARKAANGRWGDAAAA
jgi:hypothetical protein